MDGRNLGGRLAGAALLYAVAGCWDGGPPSGPGTLTATLVSPNGAEGVALVEVFGEGIRSVESVEAPTFSHTRADTVRVFGMADADGRVAFSIAVADTTRKPRAVVLEVADVHNELRGALGGYTVEIRR